MTIELEDDVKVFSRNFTVGPVEFYRIQLGFIIPTLNNTKLTILAYIAHYGYKIGRIKILDDKILTSKNSLYNFISDLRTEGIVEGYGNDVKLVEGIKLCDEDNVTILTLKKNPELDEVGHKFFKVD